MYPENLQNKSKIFWDLVQDSFLKIILYFENSEWKYRFLFQVKFAEPAWLKFYPLVFENYGP